MKRTGKDCAHSSKSYNSASSRSAESQVRTGRKRYRSGIRPLEDRVTLSATPGSDLDPWSPGIDPVSSADSVGILSATGAGDAGAPVTVSGAVAASAYSTVSAAWFTTIAAAGSTGGSLSAASNSTMSDSTVTDADGDGVPDDGVAAAAFDGASEWIVRLTASALESIHSVAEAADAFHVDSLGLTVIAGLGLPGQLLLRATGAVADVEAYLAGNDAFAYWQSNNDIVMQATPNDPSYSSLYGLNNTGQTGGTADADIDAPEAWNISTGSRSIVVGVIDTGIDYNHPDLAANIWTNPGEIAGDGIDNDHNGFVDDVHGYDFANNDGDPMDDHYHGTHVAGTIGGVGNDGVGVVGVNWSVSMMALKFISASGTGATSDAVRAVNYATMMRTQYGVNVRLTSNSWGRVGSFNESLLDAINAGGAADILFVAAAGNDATNSDLTAFYPAGYNSPYVVSVAATDNGDALASFSNYGATTVDLGAPGVDIYSTSPGNTYQKLSGTSMAAPHVAGAAALALSVDPTLSATQLKAALLATVDPVASLAGTTVSGGRLNANNLLEYLQLHVSATTPAVGSYVGTPPTAFSIDFSHVFDPLSVSASDFQVNGVAADSFTIHDADTITFTFNASPVTAEGVQTMTMGAGALSRLSDGGASNAFSGTFRYDVLPMAVTGVTPAAGSVVMLPLTTLDVMFNEGVLASSVQGADLVVSQGSVVGASLLNSTTIRYTLSGLVNEGTYNFSIAAGAVTDSFGNGNLAYSGSFTLDYATFALPSPVLTGQAVSMVYKTTFTGTVVAGDDDRLTLSIDVGQRLSVQLDAAAGLTATIEVRDPANSLVATATSAGAGLDVVLQNLAVNTTGTYTIVVRGAGGAGGAYTANVWLNSAIEDEDHDGPANGLPATAQSLDGAMVTAGGTAARAAVAGRIASASDQDYYAVTLAAGQSLAASVQATTGAPPVLRIVDGAGNALAQGVLNATARAQEIVDFKATTAGTYYVTVSAAAGFDYQLLVGRNLAFDRLGNTSIAAAQSLTSVAGTLAGGVEGTAGLGRLYVFDNATSLISELNPLTGAVIRSFVSPVAVATGIDYGSATTPTSLLVAGSGTSAIYELNPDTGAVIRTIGTSGTSVSGLAYRNGEIFVRSDSNNTITVRDYTTGSVKRTFTIASSSESLAAGFDYLYATNGSTLLVLNPATGATMSSRSLGGGTIEGLGVIGNELFAASSGTVTVYDLTTFAPLRTLTGFGDIEGIGADGGTANISDYYRVTLSAGQAFRATTSTPADGAGEFVNQFNPKLFLYSAAGTLVASDDDGGTDGRNAALNYTPSTGGTYFLAVGASSPFNAQTSHGEYVLTYSGLTAGADPFQVAAIDPAVGATLTTQTVSQVTVTFNDYVLLSSLTAADLKLDGVSATGVALVDGKTASFTLATAVSGGTHTITIGAGAVSDIQGTALTAHSSTFSIDDAAPWVVGTSIQEGSIGTAGDLTYVVTFSEAMRKANLDAGDFTLHGNLWNANYTASSFSYDASGKILTIGYTALPEDAYVLTLLSGDGRFEDASGNDLDGESPASIPPGRSGNGTSGGDFVLTFSLDAATQTYASPITVAGPAAGLVYQSTTPQSAVIARAGDVDEVTLALDAGQTLSVLITSSHELRAALEIYGPGDVLLGSFAAAQRGGVLVAQTLPMTAAGTYKLRVSGLDASVGIATISVTLGALVESERYGGADDDSIAAAQSIEASFSSLGGLASRGAVVGSVEVAPSGSITLIATDSGWYDETGLHTATNTNYLVGRNTTTKHNFFVFDLSGIDSAIVSAELQIGNPTSGYASPDANESYSVYDVTTPITALTAGGNGLTGVYGDLASGVAYGSQTVSSSANGQVVKVALNAAAVEMLNRQRGVQAAFGGALTTLSGSASQYLFAYSGVSEVRQLQLTYGPPTPDYYSFQLGAGESASIGLKQLSGSGATLTLYDAAGTVLATGAAGNAAFDRAVDGFTSAAGGTYYVGVTSATQVTYEIVVTRNAALDNGANNSAAASQSLTGAPGSAGSAAALGYAAAGAGDYYSFALTSPAVVRLSTSTPGDGTGSPINTLNPALELYDAGGTLVASNADGGTDGRNALLTYAAAAGTYRVRVVATAGEGAYVLSLEKSALTAPVISGVVDVTIAEGGTATTAFIVSDSDTGATALTVSARASDPRFVAAGGLSLTNLGGGNYQLAITPAADRFGSTTVTVTASDGFSIASRTLTLNVTAVDDRPSFVKGSDISVNRFSPLQTLVGWATGISAGPYEAAQPVEFVVSTDNPALFSAPPTISSEGTLSFAPSGVLGTAVVTVRLRDAAGLYSDPQSLTITVDNTTPTFAGLDPTFDGDGVATFTSFAGSKDIARDVARQADGKLIVVSSLDAGGNPWTETSIVSRFNIDGSLDTTFGNAGHVYFGLNYFLQAIEILQDGRIIVGGHSGFSSVAVRLNANGSFDTSFGAGGIAKVSPGYTAVGAEDLMGITVQADGKVILARRGNIGGETAMFVTRLTASGAVDTTFGGGGSARPTVNGATAAVPLDAVVQGDGKIVVVGSATTGVSDDFFALRLNTDGTLDTSFGGGDGSVTVSLGELDAANRVLLQSDGKIVLAGMGNRNDFGVVRLLSDGTLDTSFDGDGIVTTDFGGLELLQALSIQADQKIVVAGYTGGINASDMAIARYTTNGALDTTFDGDGKRILAIGPGTAVDQAYSMLIDEAQKIVVVGTAADATNGGDVALVRFNFNGSLDTSFNGTGIKQLGLGNGSARAYASAVQADGKIVVAGNLSEQVSVSGRPILWRFLADGSLDTSFGTGGYVTGTANSWTITSVRVQADGKILISDSTSVYRYTASGAVDTSFGFNGRVNVQVSGGAEDVAIAPDGKIVVVGSIQLSTFNFGIGRLNPNGTWDTSFDGDGRTVVDMGTNPAKYARSVAIQADGKIVIGGSAGTDYGIVRLNVDGSLDTTFSGDGIVKINSGSTWGDNGYALLVQQDGKIVIAGDSSTDISVMRVNADGTLDTSFGGGDGLFLGPFTYGFNDRIYSLKQQNDGKLILVGEYTKGSVTQIYVARLLLDGTLDASFDGEDGVLLTEIGATANEGRSANLLPDGRLIVAGFVSHESRLEAAALRYRTGAVGGPTPSVAPLSDVTVRPSVAPAAIEFDVSHPALPADALMVTVSSGDTSVVPPASLVLTNLGGGHWRLEIGASAMVGSSTITVKVSDGSSTYAEAFALNVVPPARVLAVYGRGAQWTDTFLNYLSSSGLGSSATSNLGYLISSGANQLKSLPWAGINTITLEFDRAVVVTQNDLTLVGSHDAGPPPAVTGFAWDPDHFRATWTFAGPLAANKYLLHLNPTLVSGETIAGFASEGVDGADAGSPSVDPAANEFNFRFNALPGDVDGSASVAFGEIGQMRLKLGLTAGSAGYDPRMDWDGSGSITFGDVGLARLALGTSYASLADPEPPISTGEVAAVENVTAGPATSAEGESVATATESTIVLAVALAPGAMPESSEIAVASFVTETNVSYGLASIGPAISDATPVARSQPVSDLLRPAEQRGAEFSMRFERLAAWSAMSAAVEAPDRIGGGAGRPAMLAAPVGARLDPGHLNWRRLRRGAAAEPAATRVAAE